MAARSRLLIELRESQRIKDPQVEFVVNEENLYEWTAIVAGPAQSPYENGKWKLRVTCPPAYPLSPPTVTFLTKCFHPNVDFRTGAVCLDILKEGSWTPAWNIHFVCVAIAALLDQPNADSPLNCDAGNLIRSGDIRGFNSMARMYTIEYACGEDATQL